MDTVDIDTHLMFRHVIASLPGRLPLLTVRHFVATSRRPVIPSESCDTSHGTTIPSFQGLWAKKKKHNRLYAII
jgi:hypothetical protein